MSYVGLHDLVAASNRPRPRGGLGQYDNRSGFDLDVGLPGPGGDYGIEAGQGASAVDSGDRTHDDDPGIYERLEAQDVARQNIDAGFGPVDFSAFDEGEWAGLEDAAAATGFFARHRKALLIGIGAFAAICYFRRSR